MSLKSVLESTSVNIFNSFQKIVIDSIIPEMISTFNENGVEIDESSFRQFFPEIQDYSEISKYINVEVSNLPLDVRHSDTLVKMNIENDLTETSTCDYLFVKGANKGNKCNSKSLHNIQGHPRCNKHSKLSSTEKDSKNIVKSSVSRSQKSDLSVDNIEQQNRPTADIKTLLAKIKAAKEKQSI